jgi:hypothetical protein
MQHTENAATAESDMYDQNEHHELPWGVKVNTGWQRKVEDCPAWAHPAQREKWTKSGVIIWDHETQQITKLKATQALWVLDQLRTRTDWKQHGMIVGEPATQISLDNPDEEPKNVLFDQIHLNATQSQELLDILEDNEETLQDMSVAEEKERKKRLAAAYDIILQWGRRKDEKN